MSLTAAASSWRRWWRRCGRLGGDRGAAIAEFVMISVLLIFLLFAVLQVAILLYVRTIVAASAADGARYAASSNVAASAGADRATTEVSKSLSGLVARSVPCAGSISADPVSGLQTTVVHCSGTIKSIFLPLASVVRIDVTARSLTEPPS
jgi:Flp pilus assembly protein TadG